MTFPRLLIAVITGGRPRLADRPTRKFFEGFSSLGDLEYVVREDHALDYEEDPGVPMNIYPVAWADRYARTHWRHPRARFERGGFHGAFTGREWAMQSAEDRGYDIVLQLDDNIETFAPLDSSKTISWGDMSQRAECVRVLVELAFSTNVHMFGTQLNSVQVGPKIPLMRPGFPYSLFLEKTGPGRMPYYGPFEDDIMHAMEYGLHGGEGRTAGLTEVFRYGKESKSKTGMRNHYNPERGLELPRRYPRNATLREGPSSSAPTASGRAIRHYLNTRGFTPIRVVDSERYSRASDDAFKLVSSVREYVAARRREKISRRAGIPSPNER